nr:MAG TPA_asm: KN motif [Caudoviricetes sp.]
MLKNPCKIFYNFPFFLCCPHGFHCPQFILWFFGAACSRPCPTASSVLSFLLCHFFNSV